MTLYVPDPESGGLRPIGKTQTKIPVPLGNVEATWAAPTLDETRVIGSREAVLLPVTHGGVEVVAGLQVALTPYGYEPQWKPILLSGLGHVYFTVDDKPRGRYHVMVRHGGSGVVLKAGIVKVV